MKIKVIKIISIFLTLFSNLYAEDNSFLPLELYNQWVYSPFGTDTTKETIMEKVTSGGYEYYKFDNYRIGQNVLFRNEGDSIFSFFDSTEYLIYDFSASIGDSWSCPDVNSYYLGTMSLLSKTDTVITPSGSYYNCIKFHHFLAIDYAYIEWFAPDVGLVRRDYEFFAYSAIRLYSFNNILSIPNTNNSPFKFELYTNFPNPFNPSTKIKYDLPKPEKVKIEVYNLLGQKIETLLDRPIPAGSHEVEFIAKNLPSGVYYYQIDAGEFQQVKKMILLK